MAVTHTFVSAKAEGADATLVRTSNWNSDHTIAAGTVTEAMQVLADNTTKDASVSAHGYLSKLQAQSMTRQTVTGGTVTWDVGYGAIYELTSNANIAITITNGLVGMPHFILLKYGGAHTVTWTTTVVWDNASTPTWQSANGTKDGVVLYWDGTTWRGALAGKWAS